ncbi:MAG TPA: hypothetical protein DCG19_02855 [Cryomorphaceae bacterium]|nr:hypothetical protein [Owenweeksia sp.]HAD96315.1 hypothetical protein [Cryomorphaceae bacterium]HBF21564.1 hypothetical protein [Cryomorphaceae bacterium]HCQ15972.1 hypothetical protein [Cryomorphaceae bacterium]|tara:strand:+ start:490 stop:2115 length:1626 start_codon:yes stop_codon:yes gene_type:complete
MFKKSDPYTYTRSSALSRRTESGSEEVIGSIAMEYEVSLYEDVQSNGPGSVSKAKNQKFIVNGTQRIKIYNPTGLTSGPDTNLDSYNDYPAMLSTRMSIDGGSFELVDYSPQTINTQVESSSSAGSSDGQSKSNSSTNTVGSSVSQTNSFSTSVSVGENFGGGSATYEHSSTVTHEKSQTTGTEVSANKSLDSSRSASMSIKDWGAYALVNPASQEPTWTFGQEYPWNTIECRKTTGTINPDNSNQVEVVIPTSMQDRLYDNGGSLYPPSELSIYGINFVMKSSWLVVIPNDSKQDTVTIDHTVNYFTASHLLIQKGSDGDSSYGVQVYIDQQPISLNGDLSTDLNLNFMALSPLSVAAIVGFIPNRFIIKPAPATDNSAPVPFKIISATNDLLIMDTTSYPSDCEAGAGFEASETSLTAGFASNCTTLQMTLYFKVIDSISNYNLFMKHWKTGATGVVLTMVINEDTETTITQYVDAQEAEGGENNMLSISLRNQNFTSVDYHDYLQLGLNSIQITIEPIGGEYHEDCDYQVRAISIEEG